MSGSLTELFLKGGWVMWPLLILSVLSWAVIFERGVTFFTFRPRLNRLAQALLGRLKDADLVSAKQLCHTEKAYIGQLFLPALEAGKNREKAERTCERNRLKLFNHLKKNLWILGTVAGASPFIGLLGTVVGIIRAFHDMGEKGTGGFSVVASGISEALIATGAGLIVAIIALITYNIFVTAANQCALSLKLSLEELTERASEISAA